MPGQSDKTDQILEKVKSAFPNGDLDGHRKAHERMIRDIEDKETFKRDLFKEGIKYVLKGAFVVLSVLLALGFQAYMAVMTSKSAVDVPKAVVQPQQPPKGP